MKTTITFTQRQVEEIQKALLLIGVELSNSTEEYVWPKDLSKKFTKVNNLLAKKLS